MADPIPPEAAALVAIARAEVAAAIVLVLVLVCHAIAAVCLAAGWPRLGAGAIALAGLLTTQIPGLPSRPLGALTCAAAVVAAWRGCRAADMKGAGPSK